MKVLPLAFRTIWDVSFFNLKMDVETEDGHHTGKKTFRFFFTAISAIIRATVCTLAGDKATVDPPCGLAGWMFLSRANLEKTTKTNIFTKESLYCPSFLFFHHHIERPSSIDQASAAAASMLISWRKVTRSHCFTCCGVLQWHAEAVSPCFSSRN